MVKLKIVAVSAVLLVLLVITEMGSLLSLVAFQTNQDFIAANLCVNRDRPELECNGKCQLIKTLEEQQPSGQPKAVPANDLIIPLFHTACQKASPLVDEAVCEYLTIMISVPAVPFKETATPPPDRISAYRSLFV